MSFEQKTGLGEGFFQSGKGREKIGFPGMGRNLFSSRKEEEKKKSLKIVYNDARMSCHFQFDNKIYDAICMSDLKNLTYYYIWHVIFQNIPILTCHLCSAMFKMTYIHYLEYDINDAVMHVKLQNLDFWQLFDVWRHFYLMSKMSNSIWRSLS